MFCAVFLQEVHPEQKRKLSDNRQKVYQHMEYDFSSWLVEATLGEI